MKEELKEKVDLFLQNKKDIQKGFKLDFDYNYLLSSFLYTDLNQKVDLDKLKKAHKILKKKTNVFSDYRFVDLLLATKMALSDNPTTYFNNIDSISKKINFKQLLSSIYSIISSMLLYDYKVDEEKVDEIVEKGKDIFDKMKKNHPFLTDVDDIPFTMILSLVDKDSDTISNEVEECYNLIKDKYKGYTKDSIYSLAQLLVISNEDTKVKVKKLEKIFDLLKNKKKKINSSFYLPFLATLLFIDGDIEEIINDVVDVDNYLGCKKGNGLWTYNKSMSLLFSILLVESIYEDKYVNGLINSVLISSAVVQNLLITFLIMDIAILM